MGEDKTAQAQAGTEGTLSADGRGVVVAPGARLVDASREMCTDTYSDSFGVVFSQGVFVDKSLLVRDVLRGAQAKLFCRPRRFGKSLAMSMLQDFLECAPCGDPVARSRFELLDIWEADGGRWRDHQGRYPVVALSLRNAEGSTWEDVLAAIKNLVADEFRRHDYLLDGELNPDDRDRFGRLSAARPEPGELAGSLGFLTRLLHARHGRKAVVLIDEYDAPITSALSIGAYKEAVAFVRPFLSSALKDNPHLEKGVLTGVQRVSKESIFSGLNNVKVNTPLDQGSDERFGFTQAEVKALASYLGHPESVPTLREWYDGYRFGGADVYNPWSVLSFFDGGRVAQPYWVNTSGNSILGEALSNPDSDVRGQLASLLDLGATVNAPVDPNVAYGELSENPDGVWSVLYMSGYLTTEDTDAPGDADRERPLRVPNLEVLRAYRGEVARRAVRAAGRSNRARLCRALADGDEAAVVETLDEIARNSASVYDLTCEGDWHMLVLGLLIDMPGYASVRSNREAGYGRFDVQALPKAASPQTPVLTLEFKFEKDAGDDRLMSLTREALGQIDSRAYDAAYKDLPRVRWGIACAGKRVAAACEQPGF
jgi:hypothetical protein